MRKNCSEVIDHDAMRIKLVRLEERTRYIQEELRAALGYGGLPAMRGVLKGDLGKLAGWAETLAEDLRRLAEVA